MIKNESEKTLFIILFIFLTLFIPLFLNITSSEKNILQEKILRSCKTDSDCSDLFCPRVLGLDTPRCFEGFCVCGPNFSFNLSKEEDFVIICEKIKNWTINKLDEKRLLIEKENYTEDDLEELERIRENVRIAWKELNKFRDLQKARKMEIKCFQKSDIDTSKIEKMESLRKVIEDIIKKYRDAKRNLTEKFIESLQNLKEVKLNLILNTNLTGRELAERIREINKIKKEIVKNYIEELKEINLERNLELKEVLKEIKIGRKVEIFNETLNITKLVLRIRNKMYEITTTDKEDILLRTEDIEIKSKISLRWQNETLEDVESGKRINFTPDMIKVRYKDKIKEVILDRKQEKIIYILKTTRTGRLLGIIPLNFDINYEISAEDGKEIRVQKPWWSFLVI